MAPHHLTPRPLAWLNRLARLSWIATCATAYWAALAAGPAPTTDKGTSTSSATTPRSINWEDLVPKGWDMGQTFKGVDLSQLQDGDPRANELLVKMQEALNNAPANPAQNGQLVRLPGYVVPLEENQGEISEFLLVPYFGACIHAPPPPANQIVHVRPRTPIKFRSMDPVWISGRLQAQRKDSMMGTSSWHMTADSVSKYSRTSK